MVNRYFCSLWHNSSFPFKTVSAIFQPKYYIRSKKLVLKQAALREFNIDDDTWYDAYAGL